jgi:hypothetical protein
VVGHQAIGIEIEGKFGLLAFENTGEPEVVIVGIGKSFGDYYPE